MKEQSHPENATIPLFPLAVGLWLGYLLLLLLIDRSFYPRPVFPPVYYWVNGIIGLALLGASHRTRLRNWLGPTFAPLAIILLSMTPIVLGQVTQILQFGPGPANGPGGGPEAIFLRTMPLLLITLILTAWLYGWRYVIIFNGGVAALTLGLYLFLFRPGIPLLPPLVVLLIQTITFLVAGYFISTLINQLRRQHEALVDANARLVDYAATLEQLTLSRERNRLARELHDTLAHSLSALSVQLETTKAYWDVEPETARQLLEQSLETTRTGLNETRRALKALRASPLEDLGLLLALRRLAQNAAERGQLTLHLDLPEQLPPLPSAVEQCIYRVAQEALENVVRHARARNMYVTLSDDSDGLVLSIRDDGVGFDLQTAQGNGHFGLAGIRERATVAGATLEVASEPGQGASIRLMFKEHSHAHSSVDL